MDWGMSLLMCSRLGPRAKVLVDLGHHASSVNVEHIISILLDENKLGGFHLNDRKYGDDDLMTGTINPLELFLIFDQIVDGALDPATAATANGIVYMLDQSHNIEGSMEGIIQSVMNTQTAYAKALLVDRTASARSAGSRRRDPGQSHADGGLRDGRAAAARQARVEMGGKPIRSSPSARAAI